MTADDRGLSFSSNTHRVFGPGNGYPVAIRTLLLLLSFLFFGLLSLSDFQSTKTFFPFHNRWSLNFGYRLVTIFTIFAPCRISKSSPN